MYPWAAIEVEPNGNVRPCCLMPEDVSFGSLKDSVRMSHDMQQRECEKCYAVERSGGVSPRMYSLKMFPRDAPNVIESLHNSGECSMDIRYMDIRFSNVCNFKCRICKPELSSRWHSDAVALGTIDADTPAIIRPTNTQEELWEQLEPIIPGLEVIYFAGGEPLITEEHYQVLKFLEDNELFDVELRYNTNFSTMRYKDLDVMETWAKFKNVQVGASLDAMGARGEYIRSGQDWNQVIKNRKRMMEVCPKAHFYIAATASMFNAFHLPDFHREWVELGYINPDGFHIHPLQHPEHQSARVLPVHMKEKLVELYDKHINEYIPTLEHNGATQLCFESIKKFILEEDDTDSSLMFRFLDEINAVDKLRGEDFASTFPEYAQNER